MFDNMVRTASSHKMPVGFARNDIAFRYIDFFAMLFDNSRILKNKRSRFANNGRFIV